MPKFTEGSALRDDLTLRVAEPYTIKGSNEDEYRVFVLPTGLTQDRDLVSVEFRPGNRAILHHGLLAFDATGKARENDLKDPRLLVTKSLAGLACLSAPMLNYPATHPVRYLFVYRKE